MANNWTNLIEDWINQKQNERALQIMVMNGYASINISRFNHEVCKAVSWAIERKALQGNEEMIRSFEQMVFIQGWTANDWSSEMRQHNWPGYYLIGNEQTVKTHIFNCFFKRWEELSKSVMETNKMISRWRMLNTSSNLVTDLLERTAMPSFENQYLNTEPFPHPDYASLFRVEERYSNDQSLTEPLLVNERQFAFFDESNIKAPVAVDTEPLYEIAHEEESEQTIQEHRKISGSNIPTINIQQLEEIGVDETSEMSEQGPSKADCEAEKNRRKSEEKDDQSFIEPLLVNEEKYGHIVTVDESNIEASVAVNTETLYEIAHEEESEQIIQEHRKISASSIPTIDIQQLEELEVDETSEISEQGPSKADRKAERNRRKREARREKKQQSKEKDEADYAAMESGVEKIKDDSKTENADGSGLRFNKYLEEVAGSPLQGAYVKAEQFVQRRLRKYEKTKNDIVALEFYRTVDVGILLEREAHMLGFLSDEQGKLSFVDLEKRVVKSMMDKRVSSFEALGDAVGRAEDNSAENEDDADARFEKYMASAVHVPITECLEKANRFIEGRLEYFGKTGNNPSALEMYHYLATVPIQKKTVHILGFFSEEQEQKQECFIEEEQVLISEWEEELWFDTEPVDLRKHQENNDETDAARKKVDEDFLENALVNLKINRNTKQSTEKIQNHDGFQDYEQSTAIRHANVEDDKDVTNHVIKHDVAGRKKKSLNEQEDDSKARLDQYLLKTANVPLSESEFKAKQFVESRLAHFKKSGENPLSIEFYERLSFEGADEQMIRILGFYSDEQGKPTFIDMEKEMVEVMMNESSSEDDSETDSDEKGGNEGSSFLIQQPAHDSSENNTDQKEKKIAGDDDDITNHVTKCDVAGKKKKFPTEQEEDSKTRFDEYILKTANVPLAESEAKAKQFVESRLAHFKKSGENPLSIEFYERLSFEEVDEQMIHILGFYSDEQGKPTFLDLEQEMVEVMMNESSSEDNSETECKEEKINEGSSFLYRQPAHDTAERSYSEKENEVAEKEQAENK